jgi:hypothetical protein
MAARGAVRDTARHPVFVATAIALVIGFNVSRRGFRF